MGTIALKLLFVPVCGMRILAPALANQSSSTPSNMIPLIMYYSILIVLIISSVFSAEPLKMSDVPTTKSSTPRALNSS